MSRSATATPPLPYFPAKVATPSARHTSAPHTSNAHFAHKPHSSKKARKHGFGSTGKHKSSSTRQQGSGLEAPFEDVKDFTVVDKPVIGVPLTRQPSSASVLTFHSAQSVPSVQTVETDSSLPPTAPPSLSNTAADSTLSLSLQTPESASVVSLPSLLSSEPEASHQQQQQQEDATSSSHRASWTSNFGKMAKAVVHTGKSMGIQFGDRKKREPGSASPAPAQSAHLPPPSLPIQETSQTHADHPLPGLVAVPRPSREDLAQLDPQAALAKKREWAEAEKRRVLECARLCSQWPQSGYNQSKWGPNGARAFYEPQSYSNPAWVAAVMKRQADLEQQLQSTAATYFTCRRTRETHRERQSSSSDDGSDQSSDSYMSSQSSPTTSSRFESEQQTIADIKAAMDSTIMSDSVEMQQPESADPAAGSDSVLATVPSLHGTRSITELDALASSMALSSSTMSSDNCNAMDVDQTSSSASAPETPRTRHERAVSCGAKRPLNQIGADEEKRRKVDEAMVVEEAVSSGVIMPTPAVVDKTGQNRQLSASTPDLSSAAQQSSSGTAMFGHVVKTSDTHPIIISPFLPTELLSTLASKIVRPAGQRSSMMLASQVDVPSLLLAFAPASPHSTSLPPSPTLGDLRVDTQAKPLGNLLLSSCPGKRLRMEGPVKGRAPVCRDLETDLRRIKNEGVGCLVCCLDDAELALLGVPWDTYRGIASRIGLDVIRLPMPDGLTPVDIQMFDSQVELICQNYTLEGINVLVHCRGGVGRAGLTASAWAIKMGFVAPHPTLQLVADANKSSGQPLPAEVEHQMVMSIVERVIAMIRSRRGLKAIESFEQVQFLATYAAWLRRQSGAVGQSS